MEPDTALLEAVRAYVGGHIDLEALEDVAAEHAPDLALMAESTAGYRLFMAVEHAIALLDDHVITERKLVDELRTALRGLESAPVPAAHSRPWTVRSGQAEATGVRAHYAMSLTFTTLHRDLPIHRFGANERPRFATTAG
jgi:hypothetical protein